MTRGSGLAVGVPLAAIVVVLALVLSGDRQEEVPERDRALDSVTGEAPPAPAPAEERPAPANPAPEEETAALTIRIVAAGTGTPLPETRWVVHRDGEALARGSTDGNGLSDCDGLSPGPALVRAKADGFVRSTDREVELAPGRPATVEIALDRGVVLTGFVRDARDDRPIAGAVVEFTPGGELDGYFEMTFEPSFGEAISEPDGRFEFDGAPLDKIFSVTASAEGYGEASASLRLSSKTEIRAPVELRLDPSGSVRGVVRDPDGKPVEGATVYAIPANAPDMLFESPGQTVGGSEGTFVSLVAKSGSDGRYEVQGLTTDGLYVLRAVLEGFSDSEDHAGVRTTLESLVAEVDLSLRAPGVVLVRLIGPDDEPVTDATGFVMPGGGPFEPLRPDGEGVLRLEGLPPGTYTLYLTPASHPVEEFEFEVRPGETVLHDLKLAPGSFLAGVLLDDLDRPVAGATIDVSRPSGRKFPGLAPSKGKATTDAEGRFRVENLRPGPHTMHTYLKGLEGISLGPVDAPEEGIVMRALRRAAVRARLVLPSGTPAPKEVGLTRANRPLDPEVWGFGGMGWSGHRVAWNAGEFEFEGLAAFPQELWLRIPGVAPVRFELDPKPGETVDLGVVQLTAGIELRGCVVDPDGAPLPGATVHLERYPVSGDPVESGPDGRFRLPLLPPGKAEIVAEAEGFLDGRVPIAVVADAGEVEIRLLRGGKVVGRVVDEEGNPKTGLDLHLFDPEDRDGEYRYDYVSTDVRGQFATRLLAGLYKVEVWRGRELLTTVEVTLAEGAETPLQIVLKE